jgi:hypothetical protein
MTLTASPPRTHLAHVTPLDEEAWIIANAGYAVPDGEVYRAYARELYEEALEERIRALLARLDEQNERLAAALEEGESPAAPEATALQAA